MKVLVFKDIKNKRWTIWDITKTVHLGYKDNLCLSDCLFFVDAKKSSKVKQTKKRFPHAWIIGRITKGCKSSLKKEVTYNPFKDKSFKSANKKIVKSKMVLLNETGKVFV